MNGVGRYGVARSGLVDNDGARAQTIQGVPDEPVNLARTERSAQNEQQGQARRLKTGGALTKRDKRRLGPPRDHGPPYRVSNDHRSVSEAPAETVDCIREKDTLRKRCGQTRCKAGSRVGFVDGNGNPQGPRCKYHRNRDETTFGEEHVHPVCAQDTTRFEKPGRHLEGNQQIPNRHVSPQLAGRDTAIGDSKSFNDRPLYPGPRSDPKGSIPHRRRKAFVHGDPWVNMSAGAAAGKGHDESRVAWLSHCFHCSRFQPTMRCGVGTVTALIMCATVSVIQASAQTVPANGLVSDYRAGEAFTLIPQGSFSSTIERTMRSHGPNLGIEALFVVPGTSPDTWRDNRLEIYNTLRSPSTMAGIEYYSASRGRMRVFYLESHAVAGPESRERVPDPVLGSIPAQDTTWIFQRDSSFGRNIQQVTLSASEDGILMEIENLTRMYYNMVPIVGPGQLKTVILVFPGEDGLSFYGNLGVRVPSAFGFEERVRDSFSNRTIALYRWFEAELAQRLPID